MKILEKEIHRQKRSYECNFAFSINVGENVHLLTSLSQNKHNMKRVNQNLIFYFLLKVDNALISFR